MVIIDSRAAAVACLKQLGLESANRMAALLLGNNCELVGSGLLPPRSSGGSFDVRALVRAAVRARAAGFVLVGPFELGDEAVRQDLAVAAASCHERDICFVDYLQVCGSEVSSLVWDGDSPDQRDNSLERPLSAV